MIQSLSYTEMNHAVPGSNFSPRMEQYFECEVTSPSQWSNPCRSPLSLHSPNHLPECEVPSPSQWSDPCRSPPSIHSPPHYHAELEKLKEEPYSPQSGFHSLLQVHRPMSTEGIENSISLAELLEENSSLIKQHPQTYHHQQQQHQHQLHQQQLQQQQTQPRLKVDGEHEGDFLETFTIKKEIIETESNIYNVSSTSFVGDRPYQPTSIPAQPQVHVGDSLRTVELMALDYYRQYVQRVSYKLGIPKDPNAWSEANVRSWLEYEAEQQRLPPPSLDTWSWTGADLSRFNEAQFRELIPQGGELYYAKLEIWREALRTSYQTESNVRNHPSSIMSMPSHLQYLQPVVTQGSPPTQPLTVHVQPQGGPYHHYVPQMYQSPTSSSSSFSPQGIMTSPVPPPLIQLPPSPSPSSRHSQSSQMPPSPLQVPTPVIQMEQQQHKQQQKTQQLKQQQAENAPKSPQKQRISPSPTSSTRAESPPQLFKNAFMEKCIDVTTLLKSPAGGPKLEINVENTDEVLESEDEAEKETGTTTGNRGGTHIHLWQFLKELLLHPQLYGSCIRWLDRSKGVFKIEDSVRVARLWGKRKNRPAMNYDKLSRSIRQYYKKNIMKKTERSQRLVYQFCHPYGL